MLNPYTDVFYDWEFLELGPSMPIQGISCGMVSGDHELYFVLNDFDQAEVRRHPFLSGFVWPYLPLQKDDKTKLDETDACVVSRSEARELVSEFIDRFKKPRLWAWYAAYDHVVLAQLFGTMMDLPKHIPMRTNDLAQYHEDLGEPALPVQTTIQHHALGDARWNKRVKAHLDEIAQSRLTGS